MHAPDVPSGGARQRTRGFTLLELMAVILMIGLLLAVAVPNLGVTRTATLRAETRRFAAQLEYARQRAVMTGQKHRVALGIEDGWYQVEWFVTDADDPDAGAPGEPDTPAAGLDGPSTLHASSPVAMSPSSADTRSYRPVPGLPGEVEYLDPDVDFAGAEMAEGWFDDGDFYVVFEADGSTGAVDLVLRSDDEPGFVVKVSPLADLVRILDEEP